MVEPFFKGVSRYVKKGELITIGDLDFYVDSCDPSAGLTVSTSTIITKIYPQKEEYKKKLIRQDGIIDENKENRAVIRTHVIVETINRRITTLPTLHEEEEKIDRRQPLRENQQLLNRDNTVGTNVRKLGPSLHLCPHPRKESDSNIRPRSTTPSQRAGHVTTSLTNLDQRQQRETIIIVSNSKIAIVFS